MFTTALKILTHKPAVMALTLVVALTCGTLWLAGQGPMPPVDQDDSVRHVAAVSDGARTAPDVRTAKLSEAQRVARLQRIIAADRQQLEALECQGEDPDGEYRRAEAEFARIDARVDALDRRVQELRRAGRTREADELASADEELTYEWRAAKDRFDLAIQQYKTLREKAAALRNKIDRDAEALRGLLGVRPRTMSDVPSTEAAQNLPSAGDAAAPGAAPVDKKSADPEALPAAGPALQPPFAAALPVMPEAGARVDRGRRNAALELARSEAVERRAAAREAAEKADSVNERFETLRKNIAVEEQLLDIAHTKAEQAQAARAALDKEMQKKLIEDPASLQTIWQKITEAEQRYEAALAELREVQSRVDELRAELRALQDEHIAALGTARQMDDEANRAQWHLDRLQNPFTLTNVLQWLLDHGPRLVAILVATLILSLVVKLSGRHIAQMVARSGSRGTAQDRENRALTLVSVFRNTTSIALLIGGLLMALDEVGLPVAPLMGGAAVLGLAVAFGAQNLIRDYFAGFMVLLEDQYGINDVVTIGDVSGAVEKITLRMTVLRDLEGALHFIPHGSITRVTNMTHGWSRAVLDVGVAYKEDADRVMQVLTEIGAELRKDPRFGPMILDGPEILGVDNLGDSSVVIKFFLKTQPLQRWPVKRELLRRIKRTFDELGIEIPFPQRTIRVRHDDAIPTGQPLEAPQNS